MVKQCPIVERSQTVADSELPNGERQPNRETVPDDETLPLGPLPKTKTEESVQER